MLTNKGIEVITENVDSAALDVRDAMGMMYALKLAYDDMMNKGFTNEVINGMGVIIQQLEMFLRQADNSLVQIA